MKSEILKQGLSSIEVEERLKNFGLNVLPESRSKNFLQIALEVIKEPMFILLISCCSLYLILGDIQEAIMLFVFVLVIIGITLFQTWKTEKALDALKDLASPKAMVMRDGKQIQIPSSELVKDDIIIVKEGDKVPADAVVLDSLNLMAEESLLTGESVPVSKLNWDGKSISINPGGDGLAFIYSGTLITQGQACAKVTETGINTEIGKIGKSLSTITEEGSTLKKETGEIVKSILFIGTILFVIIVIAYYLTRGDLIKGLLTGLTFAMAMLPEEFPAVLTIFLALGAWRISRKNVLTRRMPAIETLGSATVLCTDKTGTLTQNKMTVGELYNTDKFFEITSQALPEGFHQLVEYGILASPPNSFDPMDKAIIQIATDGLIDRDHIHKSWDLIQEYSISEDLLAMSHAWKDPAIKDEYTIACKGAPEAVFDLCHLSEDQKKSFSQAIERMASKGLRILGVAKSLSKVITKVQHDLDFEFLGLIGFLDPIKTSVPNAIKECYEAGVKVVMITGDYPITAQNIGKRIGLKNPEHCMSGAELDSLSDEELGKRIKDISIFARVVPEQKLRIVNAYKSNGEIVAMTGDGVNDAPALKASHIGIAMGGRGTEVARESAALILLDDDFSSIVAAIKQGRQIFDNLSKAMSYIISVHIPIAGISLIPVLFASLPIIFLPIHVVFLELIIDPTCSIVFESEPANSDIMKRSPRRIDEALFSPQRIHSSVINGLIVFALVALVYALAIFSGKSADEVRSWTFITLVIANIGLTLNHRSSLKNRTLLIVTSLIIVSLSLILYFPQTRELFHFGKLSF